MNTIRAGEGFTIQQVLNSNGFTLDTTDFSDMINEDEVIDYGQQLELTNQEMQRLLNLDDENDNAEIKENEATPFMAMSFEDLKPKMHSIYGDGDVLKQVKKVGVGEVVPHDAQVTLEYVGYFEHQDEPFDSTLFQRDKKAILRLGKGQMLPGLEIAVKSMKKYEISFFIIQPELAYGKLGCQPRIPANAEVLFKIELLDFLDNGSADLYDDLTDEEKKKFSTIEKVARDLMVVANNNVKNEKTKQAIREYNRAVSYLEAASLQNDEEEANMNKLLSRALTNLMVCYNKIGKPKLACFCFQRLPALSPKAHYHHGKALFQLGEYDDSMKSLQRANNLTPGDLNIQTEMQKVEQFRKKYLDFYKRFAQNSLQLTDNNQNEFEEIATDICETFINDDTLLKQQLPNTLLAEELECIKRVAASRGLDVLENKRFGTTNFYLTKKEYRTRKLI